MAVRRRWAILAASHRKLEQLCQDLVTRTARLQRSLSAGTASPKAPSSPAQSDMDLDEILDIEGPVEVLNEPESQSEAAAAAAMLSLSSDSEEPASGQNPLAGLSVTDACCYLRRELREDNPHPRVDHDYAKFLAALDKSTVWYHLVAFRSLPAGKHRWPPE